MDKYDYNIGISKEESHIISVIRVFAMFLIVLCHLIPINSFLRQILVVGVDVFFIVSGFIYGQKKINDTYKWIKDRIIRILVPVYSFYLIAFILLFFWGKIGELSLKAVLLQLLSLNGFIDGAGIGNLFTGHLWYISFILICYMITPLLQKKRGKLSWKMILCCLAVLSVAESVVICSIRIQAFTSWIPGIFIYILAYFFGAYWDKVIRKRKYITLSIIMFICMLIRVCAKNIADANADYEVFYNRVIVQYSLVILAFWLFLTLYAVSRSCGYYKKISNVIDFFDRISFEIYILHQIFCAGVLSVMSLTNNFILNLVVFALLTVGCAMALKKISGFMIFIFKKSH